LPARSIAFTANVCDPSESAGRVFGEEQDAYPPPSTEHSKVPPSFDENVKFGVGSFEFALGLLSIVAVGGAVSTFHVYDAAVVEWWFARSSAVTENVCEPPPSAESVMPDEQPENPALSTEHSNVAPDSFDEKVKVGVVSFEFAAGFVPIDASGGVVSYVILIGAESAVAGGGPVPSSASTQ
jgi:hypothetical protein